MGNRNVARKLVAIWYADVVDYTRLTGLDEEGAHQHISEYLDLMSETIVAHDGTVEHHAGDAVLADFPTVQAVLTCAAQVQTELKERNRAYPDKHKVQFRIGINLGDVIVDRSDIWGQGVAIAARLEGLADPGGICISGAVFDAVGTRLPLGYEYLGKKWVKNVSEPVRTYRVQIEPPETGAKGLRKKVWYVIGGAVTALVAALVVGYQMSPMIGNSTTHQMAAGPSANTPRSAAEQPTRRTAAEPTGKLLTFTELAAKESWTESGIYWDHYYKKWRNYSEYYQMTEKDSTIIRGTFTGQYWSNDSPREPDEGTWELKEWVGGRALHCVTYDSDGMEECNYYIKAEGERAYKRYSPEDHSEQGYTEIYEGNPFKHR